MEIQENKQTKVLLIITKSDPFGGAQRYVLDMARGLKRDGFDVVVAAGGTGRLFERLSKENIRTIQIEQMQRDISLTKEVHVLKELLSIIRSESPDIVHLNSPKAGGLGGLAARIAGVKRIIFTGHAWAFNEDRNALSKLAIYIFTWFTILLSHQTICVSHKTKQDIIHLPFVGSRCVVVHNGVEAREFSDRSDAREALQALVPESPSDGPWIGTIAELHKSKGHTYFLDALGTLSTPFFYAILGSGELEETLKQQVDELGLSERVHFFGYIDEAPRYLKAFDIFVLPSTTEALSLSILEAGQAGLPVIASRVGGIPEIIDHESNGLLTRARSISDLASATQQLLSDTSLRKTYGAKLQEKVSEEFSTKTMLRKTIDVYNG